MLCLLRGTDPILRLNYYLHGFWLQRASKAFIDDANYCELLKERLYIIRNTSYTLICAYSVTLLVTETVMLAD